MDAKRLAGAPGVKGAAEQRRALTHADQPASSGRQRRAALGCGLVTVSSSDSSPNTSSTLLGLFASLNADGQTIVVVTHERDIRSIVGREVTLMDGRVVADDAERARVTA